MEQRRIDVGGGVKLAVLLEGESGPPVLLLHGFPESSHMWRQHMEPLARQGFRVIAPDMRGYGDSDKPRAVRDYKSARLVQDLVELVRALGHTRVHVVGHDWGGIVAWHFAARHPEIVDRLVILNAPHPSLMLRALLTKPAQRRRSWYVFFFQLPLLPERGLTKRGTMGRILRGSSVHPEAFSDEDIAHYEASARAPGAARGMLAYYRAALRGIESKLPRIERPTLVLWGMEDQALGSELLDGLEREVKDVTIERFPGISHWIVDEAPERVREKVVGFLGPTA